jgi:hypothetical protein
MTAVTLAVFVLGVALIVVASTFVAAPLFRPMVAQTTVGDASERERWQRQMRQALLAIKEAEMDHRMGKLSEEDLASMRARFEAQALEAMAALEETPGGGGET